jgi:1-aminocyclopropane-1-carboxylate deaminase/D-cysteine desulfhydrase-like pyridoxal-dependent ACC family enzyme
MLNKNGISKRAVAVLSLLVVMFWAGSSWAGQTGKKSQLTGDQVKTLIASASSPEQHEQLAQYFNQKAAKLETEAKEHVDLANAYHKGKTPNMGNATLCEQAAADERKAAQENRDIAAGHHKEAEGLRTSTAH